MKWILGLALLVPAAAVAQTLPDPAHATKPHSLVCKIDYPVEAKRSGLMGTATLLFTVGTDGYVTGVIVAASSGSDILDDKSIECAKTWTFEPATKNGQPVEAPITKSIQWMINYPQWRRALKLKTPLDACKPEAGAKHGQTVVIYTVTGGEVSDAAVSRSSGDAALDQRAVACVSAWHFEPETTDPNVAVVAITADDHRENPLLKPRPPETRKPIDATGPDVAKFDWSQF